MVQGRHANDGISRDTSRPIPDMRYPSLLGSIVLPGVAPRRMAAVLVRRYRHGRVLGPYGADALVGWPTSLSFPGPAVGLCPGWHGHSHGVRVGQRLGPQPGCVLLRRPVVL